MLLEGSNTLVDVKEGSISIKVHNTTVDELQRLYAIIGIMFDQGMFNIRNGSASMSFDDRGILKSIDIQASKWRMGKEVITRVAQFEKASVEIEGYEGVE